MKSLAIIPLVLGIMFAAAPAERAADTSCNGEAPETPAREKVVSLRRAGSR
jgi:hypothetical protein